MFNLSKFLPSYNLLYNILWKAIASLEMINKRSLYGIDHPTYCSTLGGHVFHSFDHHVCISNASRSLKFLNLRV